MKVLMEVDRHELWNEVCGAKQYWVIHVSVPVSSDNLQFNRQYSCFLSQSCCHQFPSILLVLSFRWEDGRHLWRDAVALPFSPFCTAADLYQRAKSIKDITTQTYHWARGANLLHKVFTHKTFSFAPFSYFKWVSISLENLTCFLFLENPGAARAGRTEAWHLMPSSWHQGPLKDSSGLWNQPAVHRVQRFNKFQGSSQGTVTLWTATQN